MVTYATESQENRVSIHDPRIASQGLCQVVCSQNGFVMGFGGIPINYNMRMRETLPSLIPENMSYSIWAILKGVIGKDLTRITMPIWLNEPISMLQKISEFTHNADIIDRATTCEDD